MRYLRARNWPVACGYVLFIGMMAIGYFYNVTFVQLGLVDLGMRVLGISRKAVATNMAVLALITCGVALVAGYWLQRLGWGMKLLRKLQLILAVVTVQVVLTAFAPHVSHPAGFLVWMIICSLTLGVGVPATFGLTTDLIPVRDRGYAAAAITAVAYFIAAVSPGTWRIESLSRLMLLIMVPGVLGMGLIVLLASSGRTFVARWLRELAQNHRRARFANGRFLDGDTKSGQRRFWGFVALMFAIFFIDSLGFLRIIETPILVEGAWQAAALFPRLTIGVAHIITAVIAGVLYTHLQERQLFFWIFGIFALTHLTYTFRVWLLPETTSLSLGAPTLYATAVSLYTVVNFAMWADFSTPQTVTRNTAIGVALSGWMATFISTALAIQWQSSGISLEQHLRTVNALAQLFFLVLVVITLRPRGKKVNSE